VQVNAFITIIVTPVIEKVIIILNFEF